MSDTTEKNETKRADGDEEAGGADNAADGRKRQRRRRGAKKPSYEPPDEASRKVLDFVTQVLLHMGMDCEVQLRPPGEDEDNDIRLEITGNDARHVIGKKGQTLSALQFLANRTLNRPGVDRRYVSVDAEGYRSRRDDSLASMAKRLGKQAVTDGKIITFEPMSPRDRRVVHLALAKFEGVITKSDGEADDRRVQIIPVRTTE
jgi:spoIIIJ-associated protein